MCFLEMVTLKSGGRRGPAYPELTDRTRIGDIGRGKGYVED